MVLDHVGIRSFARRDQREAGEDVALVHALGVGWQRRAGICRDVADRKSAERVVVVADAGRVGGREDHVGVAGRLVEVRVDGHHEVERRQRPVEPPAVRRRQHRVAGDGDDGAHLPVARRVDLLGQRRGRELADDLGRAPHAARAPSRREPAAGARRTPPGVRRQREHRATGPVEVPGEDVDDIDQPTRQRAELDGAGADAAVHRRGRRLSQLVGQAADAVGGDAGARRDGIRREVGCESRHVVDTDHVIGQPAEVDEPVGEQHVHDRGQQEHVGARPDRDVLVGHRGGLAPARVDHDEAAAARLERLEPAREVGRGAQAAVRLERVGTEHHEEVGPVDVGHRNGQRVAEEVPARDVLRHLVDGARREQVRRAEGAEERTDVLPTRQRVRVGVPDVRRDRAAAVRVDDGPQPLVDDGERLGPTDLAMAAALAVAHERATQPVGVVHELAERGALRADVAAAEDVLAIAPDARDDAVLDVQLETAGGLAQRADVERRGRGHADTVAGSGHPFQ